jgi:hypothetical protein
MPSLSWFSRERFAVALLFSGLLLAACLMPATRGGSSAPARRCGEPDA